MRIEITAELNTLFITSTDSKALVTLKAYDLVIYQRIINKIHRIRFRTCLVYLIVNYNLLL